MYLNILSFASALLVVIIPSVSFAQIVVTLEGKQMTLNDIQPDAWYTTYIRDAVATKIVSGYRDTDGNPIGYFGPGNNITLAETLKIAVQGAGYTVSSYSDVPLTMSGHWADPYLRVSTREGFAVFQNTQNIDRPATRAEVASLFADAFDVAPATSISSRYTDVTIATPYALSIETLSRDGILTGDTDDNGRPIGSFRPDDNINRAEVTKMVMIARAMYGTTRPEFSSSSSSIQSSSSSAQSSNSSIAATVLLTETGFIPQSVTIHSGESVQFTNDSSGLMWIASDPHPLHTDYPGFDSLKSLTKGESYDFTFNMHGTWEYHNHVHQSEKGVVIVE